MTDPAWLQFARSQIGVREIPGAPTAPAIAAWLNRLRAWWTDDETPWCGVFVAACQQRAEAAGRLLGDGLRVQAELAGAAESLAADVRALRGHDQLTPP